MKEEVSAGGVIVRRNNSQWEVLLIRDMNNNWTFPKGLQESNESFDQTAIREIKEEVGLVRLKLLHTLAPITYIYTRNEPITKTVHYFLFEEQGEEQLIPQIDEGINEIRWVDCETALTTVDYPLTNKPIMKEVLTFLTQPAV